MSRQNDSARMFPHPGADTARQSTDNANYAAIKAHLQSGRDVRLLDFPPEQRPTVVGVIAQLRDELPIFTGWQTIRESHLSETRLRARRYFIPGAFLREASDAS